MTYDEMVDLYFFDLAEEREIEREGLTDEQQKALTEAERQYGDRWKGYGHPDVEPVEHTEENVLGIYYDGEKQVRYWADNEPAWIKAHMD